MPTINLSFELTIKNYDEIATRNAGALGKFLTGLPMAGRVLESKIDAEIVKRVQEKLRIEISTALQNELKKQGVDADIVPK